MFLDEAVRASRLEASRRMKELPPAELERVLETAEAPADFNEAVSRMDEGIRVIAEVKRMSPSRGAIRKDASVGKVVPAYVRGGACAVSVLTCAYRFAGSVKDLMDTCSVAGVPVLMKDFVTEPYQVLEARAYGASSVLLIAAALDARRLRGLIAYARGLGLEPLVEAHSSLDLDKALGTGAGVIGINNRDLVTLRVDLENTDRLIPLIPPGVTVVSESGISKRSQVERLEEIGVDAVLVGEALMRSENPERKLRELLGEVSEKCGSRSAG